MDWRGGEGNLAADAVELANLLFFGILSSSNAYQSSRRLYEALVSVEYEA